MVRPRRLGRALRSSPGPFGQELRLGWRNLLAATIGLSVGVASYSPISSLFLRALEEQFGWSKGIAAGALIALPITALVLPGAGWLIDRFGVRLTSACSAVALVLSYVGLAHLGGSVRSYYLAILALNVLGCATGPIAYTRLLTAQFIRRRGAALATAQFGIALFGAITPPVLGPMLAHGGWRAGYELLAGLSLAGAILAQLLMKPSRQPHGLAALGASLRSAVRTGTFWILGAAILAISIASTGFTVHADAILIERGLSPVAAALMLSVMSIAVAASRLFVGRLLDLTKPHRWAALVMALAAAGTALLLASPTAFVAIAIGVAMVGFSIGAELDFLSFFCARAFGVRHYSMIYGTLSIFFYTGMGAGGMAYGVIRDRTASYDMALGLSTWLLVCATLLLLWLGATRSHGGVTNVPGD